MSAADRAAEIVGDCRERLDRGEPVDLEQVVQTHPELEVLLREQFAALALLDQVFVPGGRRKDAGDASLAGHALGPYRLMAALGSGGMGTVYLATVEGEAEGLAKGMRVAVKVVHPHLLAREGYFERFRREAELGLRVRHPNVVPTFAVGEAVAAGTKVRFLVMEYVEGQTLRALLQEMGRVPEEMCRHVGREVARALGAIHAAGAVHRDLKPDNVLVTREQVVKVMDLGVARLQDEAVRLSHSGAFVGSLHYGAPEQFGKSSPGEPLDGRADLHALGLLLYELATGAHPFADDDFRVVMRRLIEEHPRRCGEIEPKISAFFEELLITLLEKDRERRPASAGEVLRILEQGESGAWWNDRVRAERAASRQPLRQIQVSRETALRGREGESGRLRGKTRFFLLAVAAAGLSALLVHRLGWRWAEKATAAPVHLTQLTREAGIEKQPTISPDGKMVAYVSQSTGEEHIFLMRVNGGQAIDLTPDSTDRNIFPAFSPDGERIAFRSDHNGTGGIFVVGVTGEPVRKLSDFGYNPAWSPDGSEVVVATVAVGDPDSTIPAGSEIWRIRVSTGEKSKISDGNSTMPAVSPHGWRIAVGAIRADAQRDIETISASGGSPSAVTSDPAFDWSPLWSPDGKWIYFSSDRSGNWNLWRVPIDEASGKTLGAPEAVTVGVTGGVYMATMTADGKRIVFEHQREEAELWRIPLDPRMVVATGAPERVVRLSMPWLLADVSPDGRWMVFGNLVGPKDIWTCRIGGTEIKKITDDSDPDDAPRWSPDGKRIAYLSRRNGTWDVWVMGADGSRPRQVTQTRGAVGFYPVWSPDGSRIAYADLFARTAHIVPIQADGAAGAPTVLPAMAPGGFFVPNHWSRDGCCICGSRRDAEGYLRPTVYHVAERRYEVLDDSCCSNWPICLPDGRPLCPGENATASQASKPGDFRVIENGIPRPRSVVSREVTGDGDHLLLAPDGRWLYYRISKSDGDLWMLDL